VPLLSKGLSRGLLLLLGSLAGGSSRAVIAGCMQLLAMSWRPGCASKRQITCAPPGRQHGRGA
jgi:hypothetical protein